MIDDPKTGLNIADDEELSKIMRFLHTVLIDVPAKANLLFIICRRESKGYFATVDKPPVTYDKIGVYPVLSHFFKQHNSVVNNHL